MQLAQRSLESSWLLGDDYVSKALVGIIFDAYFFFGQSAAPRATKPDGFFTFCIAIVSEAQSKAT